MMRSLAALVIFGLASFVVSAQDPAPAKIPKDTCVKPCQDCAAECLAGLKHGREQKMDAAMLQATEVCHHACLTCAHAVSSKNPHAWAACELCEKICLDCATKCEKSNDEHMKKCAKMCRDCASACADARK